MGGYSLLCLKADTHFKKASKLSLHSHGLLSVEEPHILALLPKLSLVKFIDFVLQESSKLNVCWLTGLYSAHIRQPKMSEEAQLVPVTPHK